MKVVSYGGDRDSKELSIVQRASNSACRRGRRAGEQRHNTREYNQDINRASVDARHNDREGEKKEGDARCGRGEIGEA